MTSHNIARVMTSHYIARVMTSHYLSCSEGSDGKLYGRGTACEVKNVGKKVPECAKIIPFGSQLLRDYEIDISWAGDKKVSGGLYYQSRILYSI